MIYEINGRHFAELMDYGIRNLSLHRDEVNELNVFPVPDGDTGSNMLLTLENGFAAITDTNENLGKLAERFSKATSFAARGNSGVIISRFFKGICDTLREYTAADAFLLAKAFKNGVDTAYASVSKPVEGTMLTVMREASTYAGEHLNSTERQTVNALIYAFCERAATALEETPLQLPILKSAGVVDSGGAGLLYIFEGMKKYLLGEAVERVNTATEQTPIDYSSFNRQSTFGFGYCTELLIQLTDGKPEPDDVSFKATLQTLGDSIAIVHEDDKIKLHIHTFEPGAVLGYCQSFGEFLSVKIENMSIQHSEHKREITRTQDSTREDAPFSVIAVAHDPIMEEHFLEMGADVTLLAPDGYTPSSEDYLKAFNKCTSNTALVFPNSKNQELAIRQASQMCGGISARIIQTRSDTECYAALPMIDFGCDDTESVVRVIDETLENIDTLIVAKASKQLCYCGFDVETGDIVAMHGDNLLAVSSSIHDTVFIALGKLLSERDADVITVFAGAEISENDKELILSRLNAEYPLIEASVIETMGTAHKLVLSIE